MTRAYWDKDRFLLRVAEQTPLIQGPEEVERAILAIFRHDCEPGGDALTERILAEATGLTVPAILELRRELERAEVLEPGLSIQLTLDARETLAEEWGWFAEEPAEQSEFAMPDTPTPLGN